MEHKRRKRLIEWGKTVLILLLSVSAVYLIGQSSFYDGFRMMLDQSPANQSEGEAKLLETKAWQVSVQPVRLAVQNAEGRYGLQYDQKAVDELFEKQLGALLWEALGGIEEKRSLTEGEWKSALSGKESWAYYDFLGNIPLSQIAERVGSETDEAELTGDARRILLVEGETGSRMYLSHEGEEGEEYVAYSLKNLEKGRIASVAEKFTPNGMMFAFEKAEQYGNVNGNFMIMDPLPRQNIYVSRNPLEGLSEEEQRELLSAMQFNPNTEMFQQVSDGFVARGGLDTLRVLNSGVVIFQSKGSGQARYPVEPSEPDSGVNLARKLLLAVLREEENEGGRPYLMRSEESADGQVELTFGYSLNGASVQIAESGYAAQFFIDDGYITEFTIYAREYLLSEETISLLPEPQAMAALKAIGGEGRELQVGYIDSGAGQSMIPEWVAF